MARIILGELVNDIRNAIGSTVYSVWKGIHYIRQKASVVSNPNSADQSNMRARMSAASQRWYDALTQVQRDLWNEFAQQEGAARQSETHQEGGTKVVIPDNRGIMSGFNAYVMLNCVGYSAGVFAINVFRDDAPKGLTPPAAPTALACECLSGGDPIQNLARLTWVDPMGAFPSDRIRIWGVSVNGGAHKQLIDTVASGIQTYDVTDVKGALGASIPIDDLPGEYHFQIDCVGGLCLKSPPSNVCQLVINNYATLACPAVPP